MDGKTVETGWANTGETWIITNGRWPLETEFVEGEVNLT